MCGCLPVSEFGDTWPDDVPVQVHGKDGDLFFAEDLDAAQALVESADRAELFLYPGEEHLFAAPRFRCTTRPPRRCSLERVLTFLDAVQLGEKSFEDWTRARA